MATKTFLKDDGLFLYDDYKKGKAAGRVRELSTTNPSQSIRRSQDSKIEAVLVSKALYDEKAGAYSVVKELVDDDYFGNNIDHMIDLIQGRAQTRGQIRDVAARGITQDAFKIWCIVDQKAFYADDSNVIKFEESSKVGGNILAVLMHPAQFAALETVIADTVFTGTGDGTLDSGLNHSGAVDELITLTATSDTEFDVVGSVSGALGTATVGTAFTSAPINLTITAGATAFVAGDEFVVDSKMLSF